MKKTNNKYRILGGTLALAGLLYAVSGLWTGTTIKPKTNEDLAKVSVMITNLKQNHGGSGVILSSSNQGSTILTNRHVCGVVKQGGLVRMDSGKSAAVVEYTTSKVHDICLIKVAENLGISTTVAGDSPEPYKAAAIVGHPMLSPTTVTNGHFSGEQMITLLIGKRQCTKDEMEDLTIGFFCLMLGGLPVYESYQAQHVTATIMPGSSGSPIFNANGELTGLAFAGIGGLGYALAVPPQYVRYFLKSEMKTLKPALPNYRQDALSGDEEESLASTANRITEACEAAKTEGVTAPAVCLEKVMTGDDLVL